MLTQPPLTALQIKGLVPFLPSTCTAQTQQLFSQTTWFPLPHIRTVLQPSAVNAPSQDVTILPPPRHPSSPVFMNTPHHRHGLNFSHGTGCSFSAFTQETRTTERALMKKAISTKDTTTQIHPSQYFQLHDTVIKRQVTDDFIINFPNSPIGLSFRILKLMFASWKREMFCLHTFK